MIFIDANIFIGYFFSDSLAKSEKVEIKFSRVIDLC